MSTRNTETSLLATLVGFDILWRFPARLVAYLPEWIPPIFSIGSGISGNTLFATASTWVLFAVTFFVFADRIYPDSLELPFEDDWFRLLIVGIGITSGISLSMFENGIELAIVFLGVEFMGAIVLVGYLYRVENWHLFDPNGRIISPLELSYDDAGDRYRLMLQSKGLAETINAGFFVVANAMLLAVPCLLLGVVAQTSIHAFPLPDLVILGYILSTTLGATASIRQLTLPFDATQIDIEERLHRGIKTVLHSQNGIILTMYCLLGVFLGCGTLGVAVGVGRAYTSDVLAAGLTFGTWDQVLFVWQLLGIELLLLLAAGYGIWLWLRAFKRLPAYIRYDSGGSEGPTRVPPARPVGMALVPVGVLAIAGARIEFMSLFEFAILWPPTALVVGLCGFVTVRRTGTSIANENHVIIGSLLIHGLGIMAIGNSGVFFRVFTSQQLPLQRIIQSPVLLIATLLVGLPYYDTISEYARQFSGLRRHLSAVYLTIFGTVVWLVTRPTGETFRTFGWVFFVVTTSLGLIGAILDEFTEDYEEK